MKNRKDMDSKDSNTHKNTESQKALPNSVNSLCSVHTNRNKKPSKHSYKTYTAAEKY